MEAIWAQVAAERVEIVEPDRRFDPSAATP
jgi:hypothetical protein